MRNKKPIQYSEDIERQAKNIFDEFKAFATGYRVLFLIQRHADGGETNNSHLKKIITRSPEEYHEALKLLVKEKVMSDLPFRIYASLNERNFNKAIRQFKYEQLDADYFDQIQKENFYLDVKNRFVGCLMQPAQRQTSFFLFDCDNDKDNPKRDVMGEALTAIPNEHIIKQYKTKNGWHIITHPFDYTKIQMPKDCEMKKDALLLLAY